MPLQEPKPIISGLDPFYNYSRDIAWLLVRLTAGGFLLIHGIQKLAGSSVAGFAANSLARRGIEPALPLAYAVFFLETVGALCLVVGLFTRFFAVAVGIEFVLIVFNAHWGTGFKDFAWSRAGGGWEYPLFWGLIIAAIALRGGGPYSLDRKLGREL
jgi:putative oxidoreductase